jgi:hypothetical protein
MYASTNASLPIIRRCLLLLQQLLISPLKLARPLLPTSLAEMAHETLISLLSIPLSSWKHLLLVIPDSGLDIVRVREDFCTEAVFSGHELAG